MHSLEGNYSIWQRDLMAPSCVPQAGGKEDNSLYNTYIGVDASGLIASFRKLHPFISPYLSPGNEYVVFDLMGWKCGI